MDETPNHSTQILYPSHNPKPVAYPPKPSTLFDPNNTKTTHQSINSYIANLSVIVYSSWYMDLRATDHVTSCMSQLDVKSNYKGQQ